jgi:hypothetical protein
MEKGGKSIWLRQGRIDHLVLCVGSLGGCGFVTKAAPLTLGFVRLDLPPPPTANANDNNTINLATFVAATATSRMLGFFHPKKETGLTRTAARRIDYVEYMEKIKSLHLLFKILGLQSRIIAILHTMMYTCWNNL